MCKPFPTHLFGADGFSAAADVVQAFEGPDSLEAAPDTQLQLLQWLLLQLQRTWVVSPCTPSLFLQELQQFGSGQHSGWLDAVQQSCCILRVSPGPAAAAAAASAGRAAAAAGQRSLLAYHGTDLASVHSILHTGLLSASGTRLQTTGAVWGHGVYLSTDFSTAFQFTKGRRAWQHSSLGQHLRCVLVCEVAEQATQRAGAGGGNSRWGRRGGVCTLRSVAAQDRPCLGGQLMHCIAPAGGGACGAVPQLVV